MIGITPADSHSGPVIAEIMRQSLGPDAWTEKDVTEMLTQPGVLGWLAEEAGFILVRITEPEAEILSIGVTPSCQRRGLGKTLLGHALTACRNKHVEALFLEVAVDNAPALVFYRAAGFRKTGLRRAYYPRKEGPAVDALTMRIDAEDFCGKPERDCPDNTGRRQSQGRHQPEDR
ncbi:MAG: ribosomal protein S18-alanine N-acetyltransferase [Pseudomonadota bacterium]|nr:ribosomal protein S18-alanine N-acetyltransferase [Pseudomonadota bacterium]